MSDNNELIDDDSSDDSSEFNSEVHQAEMQKLIAAADKEKIEQVKQRQIDLLGSSKLYERINRNLKETKFEAYFAGEQFKLYSWRKDFFREQFPHGSWFTLLGVEEDEVVNEVNDVDDFTFAAVPFQITQHFDSVVALAQRSSDVKIYFETDYSYADRASHLFDSNTWKSVEELEYSLAPDSFDHYGLSFSDVLHIIAAVYPAQPLKLEHLAMKKTLETGVPRDEIPRVLQEEAARGMFSVCEQVEPFIDDEGKEALEMLKNKFENSI